MTLENITTERIRKVEEVITISLLAIEQIRQDAACSIITIKEAAKRINRIGAEIEKVIYPEDQEP